MWNEATKWQKCGNNARFNDTTTTTPPNDDILRNGHCQREPGTNTERKPKQGHKLTRIPATVKVDDILCLLESEREARRLR